MSDDRVQIYFKFMIFFLRGQGHRLLFHMDIEIPQDNGVRTKYGTQTGSKLERSTSSLYIVTLLI